MWNIKERKNQTHKQQIWFLTKPQHLENVKNDLCGC